MLPVCYIKMKTYKIYEKSILYQKKSAFVTVRFLYLSYVSSQAVFFLVVYSMHYFYFFIYHDNLYLYNYYFFFLLIVEINF